MKKFSIGLLLLMLLPLPLIAIYNVQADSSGIFRRDYECICYEPNQHFIKVRHLLENPTKYDALIFGSSRVGNIHTEKLTTGRNYYNMTYSEGLPSEWLADIRLLIAHGIVPREIMLGVDDFSFRVDPRIHETQRLRIPYQENNLKTYMAYLLRNPEPMFFKKLSDCRASGEGNTYDIEASGTVLHDFVDKRIEMDPDRHRKDERFLTPCHYKGERIAETIASLQAIKDLADNYGIKLIVFFNPIHHITYLDNNMAELNEFKRELAAVTDYYDFSGLNAITTDSYYYYETSHYRPLVGDMILARIFGESQLADTDFGYYVTAKNVDEHLARLMAELD